MSDFKHTPGPYKAICGIDDEPERWIIVADNGTSPFHVATVENGQPGDTLETEEATAYLFAAAPKLLSEMERYLPIIEFLENRSDLWEEATRGTGIATGNGYRHAIAKATGKEPA